ncbi:MAG: N-glycosylase/DNA lyase [Nanoarchaeota archaeon]|nr:N-glycosylase/DNA lyase [Nanoarchaeota archaeon]
MNNLVELVENLKKNPVKKIIDQRMNEFSRIRYKGYNEVFRELVFCILAAGTSAELGIKTVNHLGDTIFTGTKEDIQRKLKEVYRFHTIRAEYLDLARKNFRNVNLDDKDVREQLVKNIKGIGMKEASHFLRNIGFKDYAIIDFHIVDILSKNSLIEKPKIITPKKYLEIEDLLKKLSKKTNTNLGELDLYLWYGETGKILK